MPDALWIVIGAALVVLAGLLRAAAPAARRRTRTRRIAVDASAWAVQRARKRHAANKEP